MGVSSRGRRRISVDGRLFIWFVREESDYGGRETLTIISANKRTHVRFPLLEPSDTAVAVVIGPDFGGMARGDGCWRYVKAPRIDGPTITPRRVRDLICWIHDERKIIGELDSKSLPERPLAEHGSEK